MKLALVLWNGHIGGAESVSLALAREWRRAGVDAAIVFIQDAEPLAERARAGGVPYSALGLGRGSKVILHPRRFAAAVAAAGPDGALLTDCSHPAAVLRVGGYRAPLVGVEHGALLLLQAMPPLTRLFHLAGRTLGGQVRDADVAVSDFMLREHCRGAHAPRTVRIHNFVDYAVFGDRAPTQPPGKSVIGCAARLVRGKGIDHVLRAMAIVLRHEPEARLLVAGDGPERQRLTSLTRELGLLRAVDFRGPVRDMAAFFDECDVVVVPSDTSVESFGLVALEAMVRERAVVATRVGGIPEVVADGETGTIVPPGDPAALADAVLAYATNPAMAGSHGRRGRVRARDVFDPRALARQYLDVFTAVAAQPESRMWRRTRRLRIGPARRRAPDGRTGVRPTRFR